MPGQLATPGSLGHEAIDTSMHMNPFIPDFTSIEERTPVITAELDSLTPPAFHNHPDYGILPGDAPCSDCIELLQDRTLNSRYYIKNGSGGKVFYVQTSYGNFNYVDSAGWIKEIDPSLHLPENGIYKAAHQPVPATLNMNNGTTTLKAAGLNLLFNNNPQVYEIDGSSSTPVFGPFNLASSTTGKNGALTHNAWPGIDRKIVFEEGNIETSYIIPQPLALSPAPGWLAFEDEITLPAGYALFRDTISGGVLTPEGYWQGSLIIVNSSSGQEIFRWMPVVSYDNAAVHPDLSNSAYQVIANGNTYFIRALVKKSWLSDPARAYPVTIDPLVSGAATYSAGVIGFTSYAPGDGFCGNSSAWCLGGPLNVTFPGQATITNVIWGANYRAFSPAWMSDGGFRMVGPCGEDPVNVDQWYSCAFNAAGTCSGSGFSAPWLATCLTPSCASSIIPFRIKNIDCFGWAGACSSAYLRTLNNTWTVTVQGQTVAHPNPPSSSAGTTFCPGTCTNLTASGTWGVPPYTYLWNPGGATTNPYTNVCPASTTTYTCTITDACGNSAANSVTITVTGCLPIELLSFSGNFEKENNRVLLEWSTASELNNSHFVIERTSDGLNFEAIGEIPSSAPSGNSTWQIDYRFYDINPPSGTIYYRLRQVDFNGENKITGLVSVEVIPGKISGLSIKPNPAGEFVQIDFTSFEEGPVAIKISDYSGRIVKTFSGDSSEGFNSFEIPVSDLSAGFYFVRVMSHDQALNGKLLRK